MTAVHTPEPLLADVPNRFAFSVSHTDLYEMYQDAMSSFWTPHEIDLQPDVKDWDKKLNDGDRKFLSMVLAFFAGADGIVNENLALNFYAEVKLPEARAFYAFQMAIETVHSETYANMLHAYVRNDQEFDRLLNAVQTIPCVTKKAEWAQKYMDETQATFAERLAGFATVEGVFFSASFLSIFFMKKRGLMPGLSHANFLISRDEGLHCDFACAMFAKCVNKPTQAKIHAMMQEAVEVEDSFVRESIPVALIGMNADDMCTYVRFCADRLVKQLGYDPIWPEAKNPFDWMEMISMEEKANFFEKRVGNYSKSGVMQESTVFTTDEEF